MHEFALLIVIVGILGIGAQWVAWRTQIPAIVLLLAAGLAAGPVTGVIAPEATLGEMLRPLVAIAVAIILFEGGLTLNFRDIAETSRAVRRVVLIGAPMVWGLGYLAAHYVAGLSPASAAVLSGIMVVTGPTVVTPLLRQARLPSRPASLLRWEAILADPVGALFAVFAFEIAMIAVSDHTVAEMAWRIPTALVVALAGGWAMARAVVWLFTRGHVPEYLKVPVLVVGVLAAFEGTNALLHEAGLLTVTVMGVVLANSRIASLDEIRRFKEVMTVMLVSAVFILLSATVSLDSLAAFGWRDFAFVALLLLVVRPLMIMSTTLGTPLTIKERILCAWIAPRGVVAFAVSGFFGASLVDAGIADAGRLAPLAFLMVVVTVVLHGLSIRPLSQLLGLTSKAPQGLLIVGASRWSIELATKAKEMDLPVLIADSNYLKVSRAKLAGIPVYYGEILAEAAEHNLDLSSYGALIAATDNDAYNALVCTNLGPEIGRSNTYQIGREARPDEASDSQAAARHDRHALAFTIGGLTLFRSGLTYRRLHDLLREGWGFQKTKLTEEYDFETFLNDRGDAVSVMFAMKPSGKLLFSTTAERIKAEPGDVVLSFAEMPPVDSEQGPKQPNQA